MSSAPNLPPADDADEGTALFERVKALFAAIAKYHMLSDTDAPGATNELMAISDAWAALRQDSIFTKVVLMFNKLLKEPLKLSGDGTTYEIRSFHEAIECIFTRTTACHRDRSMVAEQAIMKFWLLQGKQPAELTAILMQAQKDKRK